MKTIRTITILVLGIALGYFINSSVITGNAQVDEKVIACKVLAALSNDSRNWEEIIAYKNAFDYVRSHVKTQNSIRESQSYFTDLAKRNTSEDLVFCMYLSQRPQKCIFRHNEAGDEILDKIEKKMKEGNLTKTDVIEAIENIPNKKDPVKFIPLREN